MTLEESPAALRGNIPEELIGSLDKLLRYAEIPTDKQNVLTNDLRAFRHLKDKSAYNTHTQKIRDSVTPLFLEVYAAVLKRVIAEKNPGRLYRMFLTFGYMDEHLLKPEQINDLYKLVVRPSFNTEIPTYDARLWFEKIWSQCKDPSVNDFGQDYFDVFRQLKKEGKVFDRDKPIYDADSDARLSHEINGLLKHGQRLCYGQVSGYFPFLYSDIINGDLAKSLVTPARITESIRKVLEVDYSAFHRETVYNRTEKGIKNEIINKYIPPEFILLPTFGRRGVMWQEMTGRVRTSPARFVLPIFTDENLDNLILEMVAVFRWELSRSTSSYIRSGPQDNSVAGEYSDYLQFYKKNRDLSPEAREKVKNQIDKHRNNTADIFISDYRTWINYESKGLLRLNKVVREIMFKYCPFPKSIRANLERQPQFNPLVNQLDTARAKEIKFTEARYRKLIRPGDSMDPELADNLMFLKM